MSKIADYNTPEVRVSLFSEELKEIIKTGEKLSIELIEILETTYTDMYTIKLTVDPVTFVIFQRDTTKADEILLSFGSTDVTAESLSKKFDEAGIDYILEAR